MQSKYKEMIEESKKFRKLFDDFIVGAESYENKKSTEETIIYLQKLNELLDSKVKIAEVELINKKTVKDRLSDVDYISNLLEKLLRKNKHRSFYQKVLLSDKLQDLFNGSSKNTPEIQEFKSYIINLLEKIVETNEALIQISEEQNRIIEEISKTKIYIINSQDEFKENLRTHTSKKEEIDNTKQQQLIACKQRIEKINFMRVLTSELLILGDPSESIEQSMRLLCRLRYPVTFDSLKELPD